MKVWIYLDGRQQGPFEPEELLDMPGINENTKVWFEGLPKWYPAGALDEMRGLFDGTLARREVPSEDVEAVAAHHEELPEVSGSAVPQPDDGVSDLTEDDEPARKYAPGQIYAGKRPDVPCPPTYLGWAIFLTICCCSPVSLGALVASICVSSFYMSGKLDRAHKASEWAAWLIMIAFALGFLPAMAMSLYFGN